MGVGRGQARLVSSFLFFWSKGFRFFFGAWQCVRTACSLPQKMKDIDKPAIRVLSGGWGDVHFQRQKF